MEIPSHEARTVVATEIRKAPRVPVNRRDLLKLGLLTAATATALASIDALVWSPERASVEASFLPDIQFDVAKFLPPIRTINDVQFHLPPTYTAFVTATLKRLPSRDDQRVLIDALATIESAYPFSPTGLFLSVAYGLPYFSKLPGGLSGRLVRNTMPRLLSNRRRYALEEAVPAPTDVTSGGYIVKKTFNVPVAIESNDLLFSFRSDALSNIQDAISWLQGSNSLKGVSETSPLFTDLFAFTSMRTMFSQRGLPRQLALQYGFSYAKSISPESPMWMGFADGQVGGNGPAAITTFQGDRSACLTNTSNSDYFYNGSIQHFSHVILDLPPFYGSGENEPEPYQERVQYMFRSCPIPHRGFEDQFTDGGGPVFLENDATSFRRFRARRTTEAIKTAADPNWVNDLQDPNDPTTREPRMGHVSALQQSSRASDGTPMHIRLDGPGFDTLDVPDGSNQPKLQFSIFVPTSEFFREMRVSQAALRFQEPRGPVSREDNGLERFLTATRRQNFLVPSRRQRAFPLIELVRSW